MIATLAICRQAGTVLKLCREQRKQPKNEIVQFDIHGLTKLHCVDEVQTQHFGKRERVDVDGIAK